MKVKVASGNDVKLFTKPCPGCTKRVKVGDRVLALAIDDVSFNVRNLAIHVECIRAEIAWVPEPEDVVRAAEQERYEALRERIVADGTPFPKVTPILPDKVEAIPLRLGKQRRKVRAK